MPLDAWPALDRAGWNEAFEPADSLDLRTTGAELRTASRLAIATRYARWLFWVKANEPDALALAPEARATRERVIKYLHDLHEEITIRSIHNYACRLKRALELICPDTDWSWFRPILRKLERRARSERSAVRPFVAADQLSAFGTELIDLAEARSAQTDFGACGAVSRWSDHCVPRQPPTAPQVHAGA